MNAKDSGPVDYGDEDIEELERQPVSNRAAPVALAVASIVVVAVILAAWFFAIAPARRDTARPAAEGQQNEGVVGKKAAASQPAGEAASSGPAGGEQASKGSNRAGEEEKAAALAGEDAGKRQEAEAEAASQAAGDLPSFDTVRVESSGEAVLAGQAKPGANVSLFAGTEKIGEAVADGGGNWAMVLDKPLPAGTSDLWISAAGEGRAEARSRQSLAVVIDPDRQARPLVVVQDDQGSRVLQQPEQQMAEAKAAAGMTADTPKDGGDDTATKTDGASMAKADTGGAAAEKPMATGKSPVVIETADYTESGELHISGSAAQNATVRLYYDDTHAGDAVADDNGRWSLSLKRDLDGAVHSVRADDLEPEGGKVRARAEVSFIAKLSPEQERELSQRIASRAEKDGEARMASAEPNAEGTAAAPAEVGSAPAEAAGEQKEEGAETGAGQVASASRGGEAAEDTATGRGRITIERGDNLWRIAREHYGRGVRYTAIFQANKEQIRDPNLIYPGQVFLIPRLQDSNSN